MAVPVKCPECRKSLKLADTAAGKRVKCPGCQHSFVAPEAEEDEGVEEAIQQGRPVKRSPRDREEDEESDRPARRRDRESEEDDEEDDPRERRPSRPIKRKRADVAVPMRPMVYAIGACVFWCAPVIGLALGHMAKTKADEAMDALPRGRRSDAAHVRLERAKLVANIGIVLSTVWLVIGGALIIFRRAGW